MKLKINDLIEKIPGFEENQNKRNIYIKVLKVILNIYLIMTVIMLFLTVLGGSIFDLPFTLMVLSSPLIIFFMNVFLSNKPYLLGFRSNKLLKKILASVFYLFILMSISLILSPTSTMSIKLGYLNTTIILLLIVFALTLATSQSSRDAYKKLSNVNLNLKGMKIKPSMILIVIAIIGAGSFIYSNSRSSKIENAIIEYNYEYTEDEIKYFLENNYNVDEFISEGEKRRKEGYKVKKVMATSEQLAGTKGVDLDVKNQISQMLDSKLESEAFMAGFYDQFEGNGAMISSYGSGEVLQRFVTIDNKSYRVYEKSDLNMSKIKTVIERGMKSLALEKIPSEYKQRSESSVAGAPYLKLERNYITYDLAYEIMSKGLNQDRINRFIAQDNQYVKDAVFKATEYDLDHDGNIIKITKKHETKTYTFIQENSAIQMWNEVRDIYKEKSWSDIDKIYSDIKKNDKATTSSTPNYSNGSSGYIKWKNNPNYLPSQSELDAMSDAEFKEWADSVVNGVQNNLDVKKEVDQIIKDRPWLFN